MASVGRMRGTTTCADHDALMAALQEVIDIPFFIKYPDDIKGALLDRPKLLSQFFIVRAVYKVKPTLCLAQKSVSAALSELALQKTDWGFTDLERTTWANTMAKRVRTLCRHASLQHRRKPRPRWLPDLDIPEQSSSTRPTRSSAGYIEEAKEIDFDNGNYLGFKQQMPPKKKDTLYCIILY